MLAVVGVV
jgi:hypothetical protein